MGVGRSDGALRRLSGTEARRPSVEPLTTSSSNFLSVQRLSTLTTARSLSTTTSSITSRPSTRICVSRAPDPVNAMTTTASNRRMDLLSGHCLEISVLTITLSLTLSRSFAINGACFTHDHSLSTANIQEASNRCQRYCLHKILRRTFDSMATSQPDYSSTTS